MDLPVVTAAGDREGGQEVTMEAAAAAECGHVRGISHHVYHSCIREGAGEPVWGWRACRRRPHIAQYDTLSIILACFLATIIPYY